MSLTRAQQVLGSIHEDALNDMLRAFFTARPRYRRYGSPAFVAATNVNATRMDAIPFPGIPGGIDWRVGFEIPTLDLFKQSRQLPPQLTLAAGQFSLRTRVEICLNCVARRDDHKDDRKDDTKPPDNKGGREICTAIEVFAIGHLDSWHNGNGDGAVRFRLDQVELVDITPDSLESVLECLIRMVLDAALSQVQLPLQALRAGAFQLVVAQGPDIEDDRILVFGNL